MRDTIAILVVFILLFGSLYIRKWYTKGGRIVPHRGSLVPEGFWTSCKPFAEGSTNSPLIIWIADTWVPNRYCRELSRFLMKTAGWSVIVILPETNIASYDDIPILGFHQSAYIESVIRNAYCILTTGSHVFRVAKETAVNARKGVCRVISEPTDSFEQSIPEITPAAWMRPTALVLHPPFYPKAYQTHTNRKHITLIGCSAEDGAKEFYRVAAEFPQYSFLAVEGFSGAQLAPPKRANLRAVKAVQDLRGVYSQTGILVILGTAEKFPRTALEAAASGIPTVGIVSAGLQEALGSAGIFCETMEEIAEAIRRLQEFPEEREAASRAARKRASSPYNSTEELERFRNFLLELPANYQHTL